MRGIEDQCYMEDLECLTAVWVCSLMVPCGWIQSMAWVSLGVISTLLPQCLRSKEFSCDISSSAFPVLVELRSQEKEWRMRGRMTFMHWNKPAALSVGERSSCFIIFIQFFQASKGGSPSQSQAAVQSVVFTFIFHNWYLSALWNIQNLLQVFDICNFWKWCKPKMMRT